MNKNWLIVPGKVILGFIILFVFFTVHFILVKTVYEKAFIDISLNIALIISLFIFSFLGGFVTAKLEKVYTLYNVIAVATLGVLFMLMNYPASSSELPFFFVSIFNIASGVLLGGFLVIKMQSPNLPLPQDQN